MNSLANEFAEKVNRLYELLDLNEIILRANDKKLNAEWLREVESRLKVFSSFQFNDFFLVPEVSASGLINSLNEAIDELFAIRSMNLDESNAFDKLKYHRTRIWNIITAIYDSDAYVKTVLPSLSRRISGEEHAQRYIKLLNDSESAIQSVKDAEDAIKKLLPESAMGAGASELERERRHHGCLSIAWFAIIVLLITVMVMSFYHAYINPNRVAPTLTTKLSDDTVVKISDEIVGRQMMIDAIQNTSIKILWFTFVLTMLFFSIRTYTAHLHNRTVTKHRVLALRTYRAIVEAAGDLPNKDLVLAKAADSIFSHQPTGFGKSDGSGDGNPSLVNVIGSSLKPQG